MFASREEAFGLAEEIPGGPSVTAWVERAARHRLHLVAGISERAGPDLYNSAVVIGPDGYIGTFGKCISGTRRTCSSNPAISVSRCSTRRSAASASRFATMAGFRRPIRLCALQGADIVCVPTNWVPIPGQAEGREAMANILAMGAAHSNSIFIACADRVGVERGQPFEGQSLIVSYTGWPVAGPASRDAEEILIAEVDLGEARRKRNWNAFNQVLRDRRTDVYDEMLGSGAKRGWY